MGSLRRKVGFWGSVGSLRVAELMTLEIAGGAVLGLGGAIVLVHTTTAGARHQLVGDFLSLTPALLGVVFAALALVVALMSDDYMRSLRSTSSGVLGFYRPFMVVIGLQVGTILAAVAYRAFGPLIPPGLEPWLFGVTTVGFVVSCLEVVALARSVMMHGLARSRVSEVRELDEARERKAGRG